jgi:hypothetical protein
MAYQANGQAGQVDEGDQCVSPEVPEGDLYIVSDHDISILLAGHGLFRGN